MAGATVDISCRQLTAADLPAVMEIETASFTEPWSSELFTAELAQPNRRYVVAQRGGAVCGYGGVMVMGEEATILTLAVAPSIRGHRVATRLLFELVQEARATGARHLTLEVRESNLAAQELYSKFGFQPAGTRKGYYRTEDAVIMWAVDIDSEEYEETLRTIRKEAS